MYPEYVLNHAYDDTDVFVSMAKLKNHADCGVTLSLKNCFGIVPVSIYGDDAGVDEPNERASARTAGGVPRGAAAAGEDRAAGIASRSQQFGRLPRLAHRGGPGGGAAHPPGHYRWRGIHGGRRRAVDPRSCAPVKPGVLIAGLNPVCTDAVATAVMGYNPRATRGTAPFHNARQHHAAGRGRTAWARPT